MKHGCCGQGEIGDHRTLRSQAPQDDDDDVILGYRGPNEGVGRPPIDDNAGMNDGTP